MFHIAPCVKSFLFWKFHENPFNRFSVMLLRGMDSSGKVGKTSCVQGVKWNILKMFPIVPCIQSHLPRKFHENPFSRFSVMLLTGRQTDRQTHRQTRATDNDENITFVMAEVTSSGSLSCNIRGQKFHGEQGIFSQCISSKEVCI